MSCFLSKRERVLTKGERAVLEWLAEGNGGLELIDGKPHFFGYVYDAPKCHAATFLKLVYRGLIEPSIAREDFDTSVVDSGEGIEQLDRPSNVISLVQRQRSNLGKWLFKASQAVSGNYAATEPDRLLMIWSGPNQSEVFAVNHTNRSLAQDLDRLYQWADFQRFKGRYGISQVGRKALEISEIEHQMDEVSDREAAELNQKRMDLIQDLS